MKLSRRARHQTALILAIRKAERTVKPLHDPFFGALEKLDQLA